MSWEKFSGNSGEVYKWKSKTLIISDKANGQSPVKIANKSFIDSHFSFEWFKSKVHWPNVDGVVIENYRLIYLQKFIERKIEKYKKEAFYLFHHSPSGEFSTRSTFHRSSRRRPTFCVRNYSIFSHEAHFTTRFFFFLSRDKKQNFEFILIEDLCGFSRGNFHNHNWWEFDYKTL